MTKSESQKTKSIKTKTQPKPTIVSNPVTNKYPASLDWQGVKRMRGDTRRNNPMLNGRFLNASEQHAREQARLNFAVQHGLFKEVAPRFVKSDPKIPLHPQPAILPAVVQPPPPQPEA